VAAGAALVVAIGGLSLLSAPAQAVPTFGDCNATFNDPSQTITLNQDCDTFTVLVVPDGWTLDGAGHEIIAVQDSGHPSFTGAVLASAQGDDTNPATMNVRDLTVTSRGFDAFTQDVEGVPAIGISMVRAGGTLTDVTVDGIAHNAPGQLTRAIFVDNQDAGSNDVPRADVTLNRVTTTRFQKSGIFLRGNLAFDVQHATVGQSENVDGSRNLQNASNGIVALTGAHGSITDSTIGENRYPADDGGAPGDVSSGTSILLEDVGHTLLSRNVIEGTDGDTGILVDNYTNDINSVIRISCSTLIRHDGGNADENVGSGVWNDEGSTPGGVDLTLASNTFSGWSSNVRGEHSTEDDPSCSTGNQLTAGDSSLVYGSGTALRGLVRAQDGTPTAGTATLQSSKGSSGAWTTVDTSLVGSDGRYSFAIAPELRTRYRTLFTGTNVTDSTSNTVAVTVARKVTIAVTRQRVARHAKLTFTGDVSSYMSGRSVVLQMRNNGNWGNKLRTAMRNDGRYAFTLPRQLGNRHRAFRVVTTDTVNVGRGFSRVLTLANLG
jgi:hypothetical protein